MARSEGGEEVVDKWTTNRSTKRIIEVGTIRSNCSSGGIVDQEIRILNAKTLLLFIAQAAVVVGCSFARSTREFEIAGAVSIVLGFFVAGIIAHVTTLRIKFFVRKFVAVFLLFTVFSICALTIFSMKNDQRMFQESEAWAPMAPEVFYIPISIFATVCGLSATIPMWRISSIVETADPPE